jgi:hypothetical protein
MSTTAVASSVKNIPVENNSHAGQGAVVLDIGGDVGALIVNASPAMAGVEIEIAPAGRRPDGHVPHVAVVGRPTASGTAYAAVYPHVREGRYELNRCGHPEVKLTVDVVGGEVNFADWPEPSSR